MNTMLGRVLLFAVGATIASNLFRFNVVDTSIASNGLLNIVIKMLLEGLFVAVFAWVVLKMLSSERQRAVSLLGISPQLSIGASIVVVGLYILMTYEALALKPLILLSLSSFIYAVFEEYGWRGYLFAELQDKTVWLQIMLPAALWFVWHLSFLQTSSLSANAQFFMICAFASWGLWGVVKSTRSVLLAASMHFAFGAVLTNQILKSYWQAPMHWVYLVAAFAVVLGAVKILERKEEVNVSEA